MSEARKIASKYLFETDPDWALLVADIDALVEKAARIAEGWTFCGINGVPRAIRALTLPPKEDKP